MDAQALAAAQDNHTRILRLDLLEKIKTNREKHKTEFEKALLGWRKEAVKELNRHAKQIADVIDRMETDITNNKPVKKLTTTKLYPKVPERPEDHTKDYDVIISRLEMSIDAEIFITHADFNKFVLDEWAWKGQHTAMLSNYASPELSRDFSAESYD